MFEKVLLFEKKQKRTKSMVLAILFETVVIILLIFSPLFFEKEDIKKVVFLEQFFLPPAVPAGPAVNVEKKPGSPASKKKVETQKSEVPKKDILESPTEIPKEIAKGNEENKTEAEKGTTGVGENTGGVPGGKPCEPPNCVVGGTGEQKNKEETKKQPEEKQPPKPDSPRKGGNVVQAKLIKKVEPIYPPLAKQSRIQGDVLLEAIIDKNGKTKNIKVISGHTLLRQSSVDAVSEWKYEPATLNGEPVEVDTTITVKYILK